MLADDKNTAKFCQLFKVHKTHIPEDTPPSRPIISDSGSYTENISLFADNFLKPLSNLHPFYLQDTPDFLEWIEEVDKDDLPANSILFSVDVTGLSTNIPQDDGLEFCREALENRTDKTCKYIQNNWWVSPEDLEKISGCLIWNLDRFYWEIISIPGWYQ